MMIGTTVSHYRITAKLGQGGMGEVYRAHDERLDRDVAIKVLPEEVAGDKERLARFEREAKLLASLNHTNIATLHGLEEHEGQRFLVMELAEGETLAERIKKGAIPVDDALPIALQIAEGLEAAHEQGVIHRDLKPANVMLSQEGKVKILDFGLAKAWAPEEGDAELTHSPTLTAQMTAAGVLLGTAAYMSPEQARGKPVDKRADIWAFGCVLWEMLTGKRLFTGDTVSDVLARILEREPEWEVLPASTPREVQHLLRRCLVKDPRNRVHDIADARIEVLGAVAQPATGAAGMQQAADPRVWQRCLPRLLGVLALLAVTAIGVWHVKPEHEPPPPLPTRFSVALPPDEEISSFGGIALSPDGRKLIYGVQRGTTSQLYLRRMESVQATPIRGTEGAVVPFFSPDGEWLGFFADGALKKVPVEGGAPVTISDVQVGRSGASWGPEGKIVFAYPGSRGLLQVSDDGGEAELLPVVTDDDHQFADVRWPEVLPSGEAVLLTMFPASLSEAKVAIQSLLTGERRVLFDGTNPRFAPSGHIVFAREGSLWAATFDVERRAVTGPPMRLPEELQVNLGGLAIFDIGGNGSLVYRPGGVGSGEQFQMVWVDREGRTEPLSLDPGAHYEPRLAPDGKRVVFFGAASWSVSVYDLERQVSTPLTFEHKNYGPIWTPDGKQVTFSSNRGGATLNLFSKPADGTGVPVRLTSSEYTQYAESWSPDGKALAFTQAHPETRGDIWMIRLEGEPALESSIATPANECCAMFSPDGRWLAYVSDTTGRREVYVRPYPEVEAGLWQISTEGGTQPAWGRDGRELFYRSGNSMMVVPVPPGPMFSPGPPRILFEGALWDATLSTRASFDIHPDSRRFLLQQLLRSVHELIVVENWIEELKRLVPTE
jgi:serine/threonine-protein kinase